MGSDMLGTDPRTRMQAPSEALFLAQIVLLLLAGRLMGEAMQRIGRPVVMGQLIAGILLGPSVFGAIWPGAQRAVFAASLQQKSMIDAVSRRRSRSIARGSTAKRTTSRTATTASLWGPERPVGRRRVCI
jgi:hypothetical protein